MWPKVRFETCEWERSEDLLSLISKTQRRKITSTYKAAVPAHISDASVEIRSDVASRAAEACMAITRFDQAQSNKEYSIPALMLRSESSSSSQIERLTSSVRNVALAEFSDKAPGNARLIAGNVSAMREALSQKGSIGIDSIGRIHDTLMEGTDESLGIRRVQVWIGGTPYSPHGAAFVPPHATRVQGLLEDLVAFGERDDVLPLVKAAIFHAQFETIHPFTDGNGRTGRALLHRMLSRDELLLHSMLPISAGLLHDAGQYIDALSLYHEGQIEPIVTRITEALELAVVIGFRISTEVDEVLEGWKAQTAERKGSAAHRLPALLVEYPVVNTDVVAEKLDITDRAARSLVEKACDRGILQKMGNARRGAFYQASDIIKILEEASSIEGIKRMALR